MEELTVLGLDLGALSGAVAVTMALTRGLRVLLPASWLGSWRSAVLALVLAAGSTVALALYLAEPGAPVAWAKTPVAALAAWGASLGLWSGGRAVLAKINQPPAGE